MTASPPTAATRRPRISRQVKFVAAGIAGLILMAGYGTQIWFGEQTIAMTVTPASQKAEMQKTKHALMNKPRVKALFAQPIFQSKEWQEHVDYQAADAEKHVRNPRTVPRPSWTTPSGCRASTAITPGRSNRVYRAVIPGSTEPSLTP